VSQKTLLHAPRDEFLSAVTATDAQTVRREDVQQHCPEQTSLWAITLCQGILCARPCLGFAMCNHVETKKILRSLNFKEGTVGTL